MKTRHDQCAAANELVECLRELMRYHKGEGKYNFSSLSNYDRANAVDDAWYPIRERIETLIKKYGGAA